MNINILYSTVLSSIILFSCSDPGATSNEENLQKEVIPESVTFTANSETSSINWRGEVAGIYGHEGFVNLKSGSLTFNGNNLTGGEFIVDMSVIYPTDSASFKDEDGGRITDLQGHLSTDDFFSTSTYPTSKFVITEVNGNTVKGNLTIKGKTNEEIFEISSLERNTDGVTATGNITFDRQKYGVSWVHFMKDMILSDDITLNITIKALK